VPSEGSAEEVCRYTTQKENLRSELEAFEGHGPPTVEELWSTAGHEARGAASWIEDMPVDKNEIETAKSDLLKALVALEMAEERVGADHA